MRVQKTAATFALLAFLASAAPSFAGLCRTRDQAKEGTGPIQRVIHIIKRIVKPLDIISIPRP
jgi:hypothetical protein